MGMLSKLKKLVGLAQKHDDKVAKQVSKRTSKLDEDDVKNGIDTASSKVGEKKK